MGDYDRVLAEVEGAPDQETAARLYEGRLFPLALARVAAQARDAALLVLTVGEQPWSVALSLSATRAPRVLAIHTEQSEHNLDRALDRLPGPRPEVLRKQVDKADSTAVYEAIREGLDALGVPAEDVVVDFTSGTKAMTAGASTFAGFRRLRQVYIASERLGGAAGRLFGRETVHEVDHPLVVLGDPDRTTAEQAFDAGDFALAERVFVELDEARVPGFHFAARARLARAYWSWDTLAFAEAADGLDEVATSLGRAQRRHVPHERLVDQIGRLREQAGHCRTLAAATARDAHPAARPEQANALLRWLLAGARRATSRRLDLAALLTYRALELALQRRLAVHGLDASDFRPPDPEDLLARYNRVAGPKHAVAALPAQVGLAQAWTVLTALGDAPLAAAGVPRDRLFGVIEARNHSVLAHGFRTVSGATVDSLRDVVLAIAARVADADQLPLPHPDDGFDFVRLG